MQSKCQSKNDLTNLPLMMAMGEQQQQRRRGSTMDGGDGAVESWYGVVAKCKMVNAVVATSTDDTRYENAVNVDGQCQRKKLGTVN